MKGCENELVKNKGLSDERNLKYCTIHMQSW